MVDHCGAPEMHAILLFLATAQTPREDFARELEAGAVRFATAKAQLIEAKRKAELPGRLEAKLVVLRRVRLDLIRAYTEGLAAGSMALRGQVLSRHLRETEAVVADVEKSLPVEQAVPLVKVAREELDVARAVARRLGVEGSR